MMLADYCRNVLEPVYRIKEWYNSVHIIGHFYYDQISYSKSDSRCTNQEIISVLKVAGGCLCPQMSGNKAYLWPDKLSYRIHSVF
jgi:hypothetical protein